MVMLTRLLKYLTPLTMLGMERGPHITRFTMYRRLREVGRDLPVKTGRVLSISRSSNLCEVLSIEATELVDASYPEVSILDLPYPEGNFDFVLADQVLEHIRGCPQRAFDETRRVLRPGGIAVLTTCFMNPVHERPNDYWRYTPEALSYLSRDYSHVIECGSWGNFLALMWVRAGMRLERVPLVSWHPLHRMAVADDPAWPIVTWIVLRK
jgi:SAM-dependent methyltransferase